MDAKKIRFFFIEYELVAVLRLISESNVFSNTITCDVLIITTSHRHFGVKKHKQRFDEKGLKAFGVHLRQLRKAKDLTQEKLSLASTVSEAVIQKIEYGTNNTTLSTLLALSRALKVPMKELCDFKVPLEK